MKADPVKKLDPSRPLGENAARIVQVRLDEMLAFAPRALDGKTKAQHDMRIAAKRLRYVLEVTGFCFGRPADTARRRARDLQDILGEIHDCDVMLPRVRGHLKELQRGDAAAVRERAGRAPRPRSAPRRPRAAPDRLPRPRRARRLPGGKARAAHRSLHRLLEAPGGDGDLEAGSSAPSTDTCAARARRAAPRRPRGARPPSRPRPPPRAAAQAEAQAEQARLDRERANQEAEQRAEQHEQTQRRTTPATHSPS